MENTEIKRSPCQRLADHSFAIAVSFAVVLYDATRAFPPRTTEIMRRSNPYGPSNVKFLLKRDLKKKKSRKEKNILAYCDQKRKIKFQPCIKRIEIMLSLDRDLLSSVIDAKWNEAAIRLPPVRNTSQIVM
jgi:hypothetical protein